MKKNKQFFRDVFYLNCDQQHDNRLLLCRCVDVDIHSKTITKSHAR